MGGSRFEENRIAEGERAWFDGGGVEAEAGVALLGDGAEDGRMGGGLGMGGVDVDHHAALVAFVEAKAESPDAEDRAAPGVFGEGMGVGRVDQDIGTKAKSSERSAGGVGEAGDALDGEDGEGEGVEDAAVLLDDADAVAELAGEVGVGDVEFSAGGRADEDGRAFDLSGVSEAGLIEPEIGFLANGEPGEAGAFGVGAEEGPAAIAG